MNTTSLKTNRMRNIISALLIAMTFSGAIQAAEIYSGEPLAEALVELVAHGVLVAHPITKATELQRTDVFRLMDGRLVAVTSKAQKTNAPYTIEAIRVATGAPDKLTLKVPTVQSIIVAKRSDNPK